MQKIIDAVSAFEGALVVVPDGDSGAPQIAWGDAFFYYAPDGVMPARTQPYGTIVTKDYPDDGSSRLGGGRFRVNVHVGRADMLELADRPADPADTDAFFPHPLYGDAGWVSVVDPVRTADRVIALLRQAHDDARARIVRRGGRR